MGSRFAASCTLSTETWDMGQFKYLHGWGALLKYTLQSAVSSSSNHCCCPNPCHCLSWLQKPVVHSVAAGTVPWLGTPLNPQFPRKTTSPTIHKLIFTPKRYWFSLDSSEGKGCRHKNPVSPLSQSKIQILQSKFKESQHQQIAPGPCLAGCWLIIWTCKSSFNFCEI